MSQLESQDTQMNRSAHHSQGTVYGEQQKISFLSFLAELPNFFAVLVSAIVSGSLIVWIDFVDSLGNVLNAGFVAFLAGKLKKDLRYEYNYGTGKIEAIASLFCDGILACGMVIMLFSCVSELARPKQPSAVLIYVVLLKIINVSFDVYFLVNQYKIYKTSASVLALAELNSAKKNLAFDAVALVSVLLCWVFRKAHLAWYFSPVICLLLAVYFIGVTIGHARKSIHILTDRTLPEPEQLKILSVLTNYNERYKDFVALNTRKNGDITQVDLQITFDDAASYAEIQALCADMQKELESVLENCRVAIVVDSSQASFCK